MVAEATPTLSLVGGHVANEVERLRLGCCVFPKERGLCHYVETPPSSRYSKKDEEVDNRTVVVLDVAKDERFKLDKILASLRDARFYVAVPIVSPRGFRIGALSVMDSKPRSSNPDQQSLQFLQEMAATVMGHLEMKQTTSRIRRAERMIVGLGSFVEGRSTLRDAWEEAKAERDASERSGEAAEGQLNMEQQDMQHLAKETEETGGKGLVIREPPRKAKNTEGMKDMDGDPKASTPTQESTPSGTEISSRSRKQKHDRQTGTESSQNNPSVRSVLAGGDLQDQTLPTSIRNIFSRAANLIRESIGAEGVMFLDAKSEQFGNLIKPNVRRVSGSGLRETTSSGGESTDSASSYHRKVSDVEHTSDGEDERISECLGFSSSRGSSINDEDRAGQPVVVPEPLFSSLIRRYPRGKIFTYNANGSLSEDSEDPTRHVSRSDGDDPSRGNENRASGKRRRKHAFQRDADDLIKIFAGARNILLLPIWDSDRKRWFAGTLAWTNEPDRIFTFENELVYVSAFSNSVMAEIRRVDVEVAEKAKTNLVSSITHELRNPLHGILGTADILSDTAMNALQHGMVHTIESCGRTLLDTINNLLDLTFIDQYRKGNTAQAVQRRKRQPGIPESLIANQKSSYSRVKLDSVLEEVAECVFAGYCFYNHPQTPPPALTDSSSRSAGQTNKAEPVGPRASQVTVIFDIEPNTEWEFNTHAGAWRRILMNIFGNALKYTSSGYIYLGLKSGQSDTESSRKSDKESDHFNVTLTVKDTGKGIGPEYLQEGLFSPFSQEDPMASGSGLGLSIVRQAVGFLGGSIEIESTKGVGTQLSIHTPLVKSSPASETSSSNSTFNTLRRYTEDKTIGILGFGELLRSQRDTALYSSLERMCRDWFGLKVTKVAPLEGRHVPFDFYLAVQTELDCEDIPGRDLFGLPQHLHNDGTWASPVVVICQSPEEAHRMFVAAKNRGDTTFFEFVSQPCGPRKVARALDMCIKRRRDQESGRNGSDEPTRWVEMPESSHLPMHVDARDPPQERVRINKRPTAETIGDRREEYRHQSPPQSSPDGSSRDIPETQQESIAQATSPSKPCEGESETRQPSALLVDDNELNLQMLCAYARKEGIEYMTGKNGAEAVDIYKAHPGQIHVVIIGMFNILLSKFTLPAVLYTVFQLDLSHLISVPLTIDTNMLQIFQCPSWTALKHQDKSASWRRSIEPACPVQNKRHFLPLSSLL